MLSGEIESNWKESEQKASVDLKLRIKIKFYFVIIKLIESKQNI